MSDNWKKIECLQCKPCIFLNSYTIKWYEVRCLKNYFGAQILYRSLFFCMSKFAFFFGIAVLVIPYYRCGNFKLSYHQHQNTEVSRYCNAAHGRTFESYFDRTNIENRNRQYYTSPGRYWCSMLHVRGYIRQMQMDWW